jgi:hypothetical protein
MMVVSLAMRERLPLIPEALGYARNSA